MPELQLVRPGWWLQGFGTIDAGMLRRRHGGEGGGETSRHASAVVLFLNQKIELLASGAAAGQLVQCSAVAKQACSSVKDTIVNDVAVVKKLHVGFEMSPT
jgi:hypothetical protein